MGAPGGFRTWLEADMKAESQPWFTAQDQFEYEKAFAGGYAAPICWYKAQLEDVNAADDESSYSFFLPWLPVSQYFAKFQG